MKMTQISRLLPALTFACTLGMAPVAMAQTAAPAGTMAGMNMAAPAATTTHTAKPTTAKLPKADAFKTAAEATAHCPGDTVVWASLSKSKSFHTASSKLYGKTKHGAYVCKADATSFGFHQAKN
jgi:hypothetical protein